MPKNNRRWLIQNLLLSGLFCTAWLLFGIHTPASGQSSCSCTNCPQPMPDNFLGNFYIQVQNAINPVLGQNGQGVCGVTLRFNHEYVGDLEITLTAPGGQTVTLVGPIGLYGETDGTSWDVTFVPCNNPANPDPGFADTWSNDQTWGLFGSYTGSYYPASGCLEGLNGSPVNGQWTLTVTDVQNNDGGNFYDYAILFCDPAGIECVSCEANAGNLLQEDITACAGSDKLLPDLPPSFKAPQVPPPSGLYSYTYIVAQGGVIIAYDTLPDLQAYKPGTYTVCGLSFLTSDSTEVPLPDGVLTVSQLSTQLNSSTPPFCGNITSNCINVNILPPLPDVDDYAVVCAPECYEYHGELYCQSGDYTIVDSLDGCTYSATLHLTVLQPPADTVYETICAGACAKTPGFESICEAGTYTIAFPATGSCDSIATLHLEVLHVEAIIDTPPVLSCDQPGIELMGDSSTTGPGITYLWTVWDGGTLIGPTDLIKAQAGAAGTYALEVCNTGAGLVCCDTATVIVQADTSPPPAPDMVLGPTQVCFSQIQNWAVDPVSGATGYAWTIPQGVTILDGQDSSVILLRWDTYSSDSICVQAANACGLSTPVCLLVAPVDSVANPGIPAGPTQVCLGDTVLYSVSVPTDSGYKFLWDVPGDATILEGQGTDSVTILWKLDTDGAVCVQAINACDSSTISCLPVRLIEPILLPGIQGADSVCAGSMASYQIAVPPDVAAIQWQVSGGSIVGSKNTGTVQVEWSEQAAAGTVCFEAGNSCGTKTTQCLDVVIRELPKLNAGTDTAVCSDTYILQADPGIGYWQQLTGPGSALFADGANSTTQVKVDSAGLYLFQWLGQNVYCAAADTVAVQFSLPPSAQPGLPECDAANAFYTLPLQISGGSPPYTVNGVATNSSTYISPALPSGSSYTFEIIDASGCTAAISGNFTCACTSSAGLMSTEILNACAGQTITAAVAGGVILDGNDTRAFILHSSAGPALGQVFDQNDSGTFGWLPGMNLDSTYYISLVVGNNLNGIPDPDDPCLSVAPGQPVVFSKPPAPDAGEYAKLCGLSAPLSATPGTGTGQWSPVSGPGTTIFSDVADPASTVSVSLPGIYSFKWTETSGGCTVFDTVSLVFLEIPKVYDIEKTCTGLNTTYIVQFNVIGGLPPYVIDGLTGAINAASFLSALLPNNSSYTFSITDANGCTSPEASVSHSCQCVTDAGTMHSEPAFFCANQPAIVLYNNDGKLDGDDTVQFVLHDLPGNQLGNIYARNTEPSFQYNANLQTGQTYFISAVAGNNKGGEVDLTDPCLSVTPGTPITWIPLPDASIAGDTAFCVGGQALLQIEATGIYPVTVTYADSPGGQLYSAEITGAGNKFVPVSPVATTTYTLISVQDASAAACAQLLKDSVNISVQKPVFAGSPIDTASYCEGDTLTVLLGELLAGADLGGGWKETSDSPSTSGGFDLTSGAFNLLGQTPGLYRFRYRVPGALCPDDSAEVSIFLRANPNADAGPDAELDCFTTQVVLGGSGTTVDSGVVYSWSRAGSNQPLGANLTLNASSPGHYFLSVADRFGCKSVDSVTVIQRNAPLNVSPIQVVPVRCFGEKNGSIIVDSVSGGSPPVLFSLNGKPFSALRAYRNLSPGHYILVAQDVAGCEWADTLVVSEPPPVKIDLGPDVEAALGDSVYLWLQSSLPISALDTVIWRPLLDTARLGTLQQHILPQHSQKIIATVADKNGCHAADEILLRIDRTRRVYIPNVFKPGSANDDRFRLSFGPDVRLVERMEVHDRWGELLYQARNCLPGDALLSWDGTFNGRLSPTGVYVVRLIVQFLDGEREAFTADVTLVR